LNCLNFKQGSYLVNIARGRLLDYKAVFDHLESGHLAGLGIDVAWMEPFDPEDPVLKFSNVVITPHVAGVTEYSYRTMAKVRSLCSIAPFKLYVVANLFFSTEQLPSTTVGWLAYMNGATKLQLLVRWHFTQSPLVIS